MKLIIKRITSIIYQSDSLLELELDPLSLSGIDYWSQEARSAKSKLLMDDTLESILVGSLREIKAGFHTFAAFIYDDANSLIYTGVLPESSFSVEYLSLSAKTVELELLDYLGLILQLASDRLVTLADQYINPVATIPSIIGSIIHPLAMNGEPDTDSYTNADVLRLILCIGPINYQYAHYSYNQAKWLPFTLVDHVLADRNNLKYTGYMYNEEVFGFTNEGQDYFLVYWQACSTRSWNHFRWRKFALNNASITPVESEDLHNIQVEDLHNIQVHEFPPAPEVAQYIWGIGNYRIESGKAYYSGPGSLNSIEIVPGEYKAKDLLGELLRVANAVIIVENYSFHIKNRQDDELPVAYFADPIEFELDQADTSAPELTPVAVASQAILDAISSHYRATLEASPFDARLNTHLYSEDYSSLGLSHPYELLNSIVVFDHYHIRPLELSYDPISHSIEISGRAYHE
ncbi:MAG TPA: hypothetical protein PLM99_00560 [Candidatus Cloacimonadota bacterium]|nr:hypothetical protein [Candidatus Cloacimonadota bacterium]HOR59185.1 hypothetical protein [Candidatus Cloacimonadota bacterium]HPL23262.1 hypothetical protein [Candidatus Cloacimonadota bacterium]